MMKLIFLTLPVIKVWLYMRLFGIKLLAELIFEMEISQTGLINFLYYYQLIKESFIFNSKQSKKVMIRNQKKCLIKNRFSLSFECFAPPTPSCSLLIDKKLCATM